jgi:cysteine protease ATG4
MELGSYQRLVHMIWNPEPVNDATAGLPIYCLGVIYPPPDGIVKGDHSDSRTFLTRGSSPKTRTRTEGHGPSQSSVSQDLSSAPLSVISLDADNGWPSGFMQDFESRIWMTYRSDFPLIPKSNDPKATSVLSLTMRIRSQLIDHDGFTSDTGWGCMIRSGQSMLANAMLIQQFGRDWRRGASQMEERRLLSLFADDPRAPYSIHSFVRHGAGACGKFPGEWFGPSATASCIQALVNVHRVSPLRVYSTGDRPEVNEQEFFHIAKSEDGTFQPTLLLVGTRLGIDRITAGYWEGLLASFQMPQSVGIAGGRPSSSHYFVGTQGEYLFYLDPHHTRRALPYRDDPATYEDSEVDSCHTTRLRRLHIKDMDPSMLIGFLIRHEGDWHDWKNRLCAINGMAPVTVSEHLRHERGFSTERASAIDEVESLSDGDDKDALA